VLPRLVTGVVAARDTRGRGTLFPLPRLAVGGLMDRRCGTGWRLVLDATLPARTSGPGITVVSLADDATRETEGVVAAWMARHGCHAALVRPDHYVYGTAASTTEIDALLAEWQAALAP
jgi:3-(3-hydroxy-phenyl)propionate hydroxylase